MVKTDEGKLQNRWLSVPIIILKSKIGRGVGFTDEDRRMLVDAALAMGRKLMRDVVTIVKPETMTYFFCKRQR